MIMEAFSNEVALGLESNAKANPPGPGTLDIHFWDNADVLTTTVCMATIASMVCDNKDQSLFSSVTITYPEHLPGMTKNELSPLVEHFLGKILGLNDVQEKTRYVFNRLSFLPLPVESKAKTVLKVEDHGALIIVQAAKLIGGALTEGGLLAPELELLLEQAVAETNQRPIGMMIDVGSPAPENLSDIKSIMEASHVAVTTAEVRPSSTNGITSQQKRWVQMMQSEGVRTVIKDISEAEGVSDNLRPLLKCGFMIDAGLFASARALFGANRDLFEQFDLGNALIAAHVAVKVGEVTFAKSILEVRIVQLETDTHFEIACLIAEHFADSRMLNEVVEKWQSALPNSKGYCLRAISSAVYSHKYEIAVDLLARPPISDSTKSGMWRWFSENGPVPV
jgi:hypothetical protein